MSLMKVIVVDISKIIALMTMIANACIGIRPIAQIWIGLEIIPVMMKRIYLNVISILEIVVELVFTRSIVMIAYVTNCLVCVLIHLCGWEMVFAMI